MSAAVAVSMAALLAACGGGGGSHGLALPKASPSGQAGQPGAATASTDPGALGGEKGKPPRTFACSDLGPDILTGALKAADPKISFLKAEEPSPASAGEKECVYSYAANQQPLGSDVWDDVRVDVKLKNPSELYALGTSEVHSSFDHDKGVVQQQVSAPTANQVVKFQQLNGLGVEAYEADYLNRDDSEVPSGVLTDVLILRSSQPEVIEVDLSYDIDPDSSIPPVPVAQDPFQNDTHLQTAVALAKAVEARVDGGPGHGDNSLNTDPSTTVPASALPPEPTTTTDPNS